MIKTLKVLAALIFSITLASGGRLIAAAPLGLDDVQVAEAQSYVMTDLGLIGAAPFGINISGQIAGASIDSIDGPYRAFVWGGVTGVARDLATLGGGQSVALGINDAGDVVGYSGTAGDATYHAFLSQSGAMQDLGTLGGNWSVGAGINDATEVVGKAGTADDASTHAFLWQNGMMQDLGTLEGFSVSGAVAINRSGQVVGWSRTADFKTTHAFLWQNGIMRDLGTLDGGRTFATGINGSGQVVGCSETADGKIHAFLWQDTVMRDLGALGDTHDFESVFFCTVTINASGQIAGSLDDFDDTFAAAFVYRNGVMTDLSSLIPSNAVWITSVTGINDAGQIVGYGWGPSGYPDGFRLEPSADNP